MTAVVAYLLLCTAGSVYAVYITVSKVTVGGADYVSTMTACAAVGALGGCLYCLRAVYLNKSVHKRWDADWHVWYFLRPLTSAISGGASYLLLNAGLILLEAGTKSGATHVGYFALAFVAGLNVDRFVARIEDFGEFRLGNRKVTSESSFPQASEIVQSSS